jgi:hypothetical protein
MVPSSANGAWFWLMGTNCPLQSLRRVVEAHRWQDALVYYAAGVAGVGDGVAGCNPYVLTRPTSSTKSAHLQDF